MNVNGDIGYSLSINFMYIMIKYMHHVVALLMIPHHLTVFDEEVSMIERLTYHTQVLVEKNICVLVVVSLHHH